MPWCNLPEKYSQIRHLKYMGIRLHSTTYKLLLRGGTLPKLAWNKISCLYPNNTKDDLAAKKPSQIDECFYEFFIIHFFRTRQLRTEYYFVQFEYNVFNKSEQWFRVRIPIGALPWMDMVLNSVPHYYCVVALSEVFLNEKLPSGVRWPIATNKVGLTS